MLYDVELKQITRMGEYLYELSDLLKLVVDDGASIGFLPPLDFSEAKKYWLCVLAQNVILIAAKINQRIVGSVQLHLCTKENGNHRAEIAKLMTHPDYRSKGIGKSLVQMAENRAIHEGRSLIVLDTREGDPSNNLYTSLGYIRVGRIPDYAKSENGNLDATVLYYKKLS
ncbi:GNAT family N-acetyltransferase [Bacillus sp. FJAT-49736]|uniref:GNAT family N-acetyltransferase n=1 Tax=Bacillus sp. FJAT-49736 TaxID=2833582 RepID=UPI001BC91EF9|nr:GNAT family N-acetyltransferase [Bacillus sp. FJAT-49736]MBS4172220.1 GNAT family N-acetyltransferase [Bacillus sp. FJAT-49736]